jgi:hypothetical protein
MFATGAEDQNPRNEEVFNAANVAKVDGSGEVLVQEEE